MIWNTNRAAQPAAGSTKLGTTLRDAQTQPRTESEKNARTAVAMFIAADAVTRIECRHCSWSGCSDDVRRQLLSSSYYVWLALDAPWVFEYIAK